MNVLYKYLILAVLAGSLPACTERINISTDASTEHLVIYGYISTDTTFHTIKITRSTGYFVNTKPKGISDATVTISNEEQTFVLQESSAEPGLYVTKGNVYGKPGQTYTLNVSLDFDGDGILEDYDASSYLPYPATVDSIDYKDSDMLKDHVEILLWGNMPDTDDNYLTLQLVLNNYPMDISFEDYVVLDDEYIDKKEMIAVPCYYHDLDDYEFEDGDILTLRVDAVTKEYATFVEDAQSELRGGDPVFSGPPANIKTNIKSKDSSNEVPIVGFFTAMARDEASVVYKAKE